MTNKENFSATDVELIKREALYSSKIFNLVRNTLRHKKFDGEWSRPIVREVLERKPAVGVLLFDPDLDNVILIEQFRAGAMDGKGNPWLLEIVAGINNHHEKPEEVAIREAKEEANADILDLVPICEYFVSPGGTSEYLHIYAGRVDSSQLGGVHGLDHEDEDIRAFCVPTKIAFQLVKENKIRTAPVIVALLWLELNHEWLKKLWQKK